MGGEWREVQFEEVCNVSRGASPRPIHEWVAETGIPWVKISDASSAGSRFIERTSEYIRPDARSKSVSVYPGDLILSNSATPGIPMFMGIEACIHDGWLLLRNFRNLDKLFAYYLLLHERPALIEQGSGSVFTNLKTEILKKHRFRLPPLHEQRAIAHILGTLDDKIELNRRMNETLEQMARAIFKAWFVDFEPVRAKMSGRWKIGQSLPGLPSHLWDLFPDRLVNSELGEIPSGWQVGKLGDALEKLVSGSRPVGGAVDKGIPSVGAENIIGLGKYDFSKEKYVPAEFFDNLQRKGAAIRPGDVLLYKDGAQIGRKTYFDCGFPHVQCAVNEHVFIIRSKHPYKQRYLYFWLDQDWMTKEIMNLNSNSAQPGINQQAVRSLPFLNPPYSVLEAFDQLLKPLIDRIFRTCFESRTLAALRDALLPKLISGEIRVKDVERFIKEAENA